MILRYLYYKYKGFILLLAFIYCLSPALAQKAHEKAYTKAIQYFNAGKEKKGFMYLEKALQLNPAYYDALYARSYYNFERGNYLKAIPDYDTLVAHHPQDTTLYRYRGLAHLYTQNYTSAETDLLKALSLDSTDSSIYSDLGYFYYQVLDYEEAQRYFDRSITIKPSRFAYYQKAQTHYSLEEYEKALAALEKNLQSDAKDADALRLKALILMNMRKYTDALKIYEQLLANGDIEEPDDFFNWGLTYYMQKKYPQALTYFTTPKKHTDPELYYYTGLTQYRLKDNKAALKAIDKALTLSDVSTEEAAPLLYNRAVVRWLSKDTKGAVQDYLQSVLLMPEIIKGQNEFGDTLDLLGNASQLLKGNYTQKQIDSVIAIGYTQRAGQWFEKDGLEKEALEEINKAIQLDSTKAWSRFTRARIFYFSENYHKALQDVNKAIQYENKGDNAEYYHLRGLIFYEMEQSDKAHQDFSKAIALNSTKAAPYYDRAFTWAASGEFEKAITDMNQAIALDSTEKNTYLLARAGFYNEMKDFEKALLDCNEILGKSPERAIVYYHRGIAFSGLKKYDEAVKDFTKAVRMEPDFAEASEKLKEALQAR